MTVVFNKEEAKELRRRLRRNMPQAEVILWARLKGKQLGGIKFRRQYSIGRFVVDFYCPAARLVVEVDGETHLGDNAERKDTERQHAIEALGVQMLRVWNTDVYQNINGVLERIIQLAKPEELDHP